MARLAAWTGRREPRAARPDPARGGAHLGRRLAGLAPAPGGGGVIARTVTTVDANAPTRPTHKVTTVVRTTARRRRRGDRSCSRSALVFLVGAGAAVIGVFHDRIGSLELGKDGIKIDLTAAEGAGAPRSSPARRAGRRRRTPEARRYGALAIERPGAVRSVAVSRRRRRPDPPPRGLPSSACDRRPPRPGRVLRRRRGAREPRAAGRAARRRRRSARPRRRRDRELRRAALRGRLGDVVRRGAPPLPPGGLRPPARRALPRVLARGLVDRARDRADGRAGRDRRGLPRPRRESRPRSTTRARSPRRCGRSCGRGRGSRARSASRPRRSSRRSPPTGASPAG